MKHLLLMVCFFCVLSVAFCQADKAEESRGKFSWNNTFVGGSINVGASNGGFAIGAVPEIGYSITKWLDAGILFNVNYQTQKVYTPNGIYIGKLRAFNYGSGAFIRIWPIEQVFISIQPEHNWIKQTFRDINNSNQYTETLKAGSLLLGVGYGGRSIGKQISYISVMIDVMTNINSPYRDMENHAQPVIRGGFGIYLGRKHR